MTEAAIQLPPTPPAVETKLGEAAAGFFPGTGAGIGTGEIRLVEEGAEVFDEDDEEAEYRTAAARDNLVLVSENPPLAPVRGGGNAFVYPR